MQQQIVVAEFGGEVHHVQNTVPEGCDRAEFIVVVIFCNDGSSQPLELKKEKEKENVKASPGKLGDVKQLPWLTQGPAVTLKLGPVARFSISAA